MAERGTVACRVDFQTLRPEALKEQTGRLELFSATGCTILIAHHPAPDAALELRIYLPGLTWPLRVDQVKVTGRRSDAFTMKYLSLAVAEELRLGDYLANTDFFVDESSRLDPVHADR